MFCIRHLIGIGCGCGCGCDVVVVVVVVVAAGVVVVVVAAVVVVNLCWLRFWRAPWQLHRHDLFNDDMRNMSSF